MIPSAIEIASRVRAGEQRAVDVARSAIEAIGARDPTIRAFISVLADRAVAQAGEIDARVARGEDPGPLAGVPVALKDNICLGWGRTTCASRMLENYESPYTAGAARRLMDAGAVIVGKTNLDEFAMGSSTEHSCFGPTRNPHDPSRVPGGSSGGSAAAVAAGLVPLAIGSDTGGSIRQPAAFCGVVGLKPSYGRVSRSGLVAFASSLDQIGPLTRTVADAALALDVMSGVDPLDATSADAPPPDALRNLEAPVGGLKIAVLRRSGGRGNHGAVDAAVEAGADLFRRAGAETVGVEPPLLDEAIGAYYVIATAEASSNLARYDGVRYGRRAHAPGGGLEGMYARSRTEGFGAEVRRRIMLGTHVLSSGYHEAYYGTAQRARRLIVDAFRAVFDLGCQALLMPATPGPAFKIGAKLDDPLAMYLEDVYTVGVNLAGLPAIVLPAAHASEGGVDLPIGVQLVGRAFDEGTLLRVARLYERENGPALSRSRRAG